VSARERVRRRALSRAEVAEVLRAYKALYDEDAGGDVEARKRAYRDVANHFYDLVTDFYEWAWGDSFHFAPRRHGEAFRDSIRRLERFLADALELAPGKTVLDVGCGIGGPLCEIARHSGAAVIGLNNNAYQVAKAEANIARNGLGDRCSIRRGDFMQIPLPDASVDAAYSIESTPHAPDKAGVFREIWRVLEPGGVLGVFEWCLTARFDADDARHRALKFNIEIGNGLPELATTDEVLAALGEAGFDVLESHDATLDAAPETPWYRALQGRDLTLLSLPRSPVGRAITNMGARAGETIGLLPRGTGAVSRLLNKTADSLVAAGEAGIFTPNFFVLARRPSRSPCEAPGIATGAGSRC